MEVPAGVSPRVRCILSLPESAPTPPADLIEAFVARQIEVRKCVGPIDAMMNLVILHRDDHAAVALVVVEPDWFESNRADELLRSAGKYAPRAARWVYDQASTPRLRKWIEPPPADGVKVNGIRAAIREVEGQPPLRLTGFFEAPAPSTSPASPEVDSETPAVELERSSASSVDTLTAQELAMLLGPEEAIAPHNLEKPPSQSNDDEPAGPTPTYEEFEE